MANANDKLIMNMLKCDGTMGNCMGCIFEGHPECRNAMAHHAGALIQLQDVVIVNQTKELVSKQALIAKRNGELQSACKQYVDACGLLGRIATKLDELRHCATCQHEKEPIEDGFTAPAACRACKLGESRWELAEDIIKPPVEDDADDCEAGDEDYEE